MGATNAKLGPPVGNLTFEETMQLRRTFIIISGCDGTEMKNLVCPYNIFQRHCETYLDDWLAKKVVDRLATKGKGTELIVTLNDFQLFGSAIFNTGEEKFETIWSLLSEEKGNSNGNDQEKHFQADEIYKYTRSIIESYVKISQQSPHIVSWKNVLLPLSEASVNDLALYLLQDLFHHGVNEKDLVNKAVEDPKSMKDSNGSLKKFTIDQVVKALSQNLLFVKIHSTVYSECFTFQKLSYSSIDMLPFCFYVTTSFGHTGYSVLDLPKLIFLNVQLPPEHRTSWKHLYSSNFHGESFSKFLSNVQNKGPTLLIIKDNSDRIFGAYASENWNLGPKFYGNEKSFLFHLTPRFVTYTATGHNKNFQYFNMQQKTMPNGMGMGGTLEYFGLWIDSEFGKGKCSPSCTTYNCPQLSTTQDFTITHMEVWGVGEEPKKEEGVRDQSILDKDPEAKAMLEMMGKHQISEGHRDVPKDK
jgi:hypothetical protein